MWRVVRLDRSRAMRRLGRRGLLLMLGGLSWLLIGVNMVRHPETQVHRFTAEHPVPRPNVILHAMDSPHWGWAWIVFGTVAFLSGLFRHSALVRRHDAIGFNALLTPPFLWMVFFIWSGVVYLISGGGQGRDGQSFYGLIVWFLVSLFILVVAGWAEPTEAQVRGRPDDDDESAPG
jgi:hypothetical protein